VSAQEIQEGINLNEANKKAFYGGIAYYLIKQKELKDKEGKTN